MKGFKDFIREDAPTNAVAGGGVDFAPTAKQVKKLDRRSRYDSNKMYSRAKGTKYIQTPEERKRS